MLETIYSTDTSVCCTFGLLLAVCCHFFLSWHMVLSGISCVQAGLRGVVAAWCLLCVNFSLGLCWGVDTCGRLKSRGGQVLLWLVGFQKYVKDPVGEDS